MFIQGVRLIYFGPGIHKPKDLPSGEIKIPSNTTVYLAPGAVVRAKLCVDRAKNVRIIGRGILANPLRGVEITHSKNVLVEGITMINPQHYTVFGGESKGITVRNIKSFSRHGWSDGIDLMCCHNVEIDNVFMRNSDDCIALYNHRWWYWGGTSNIRVTRAKLWADVAHPFSIGGHGDDRSRRGEVLRDVVITNCDVLNEDGDGIFSIRCGDKNRVQDIHFENIRIEDIERGALFSIRVLFSDKYNRAPGNYIRDVKFKDIHFVGNESRLSRSDITHYDEQRKVENITFEKSLGSIPPAEFFTDIFRFYDVTNPGNSLYTAHSPFALESTEESPCVKTGLSGLNVEDSAELTAALKEGKLFSKIRLSANAELFEKYLIPGFLDENDIFTFTIDKDFGLNGVVLPECDSLTFGELLVERVELLKSLFKLIDAMSKEFAKRFALPDYDLLKAEWIEER